MDRLSSISSYPTNGKRRVVSAESIAKRRYYPLDERDVDAAAWVLRQLDVAPTDKLAAFVFNTLPVRVAKARRLLDQRNRRNGGHHSGRLDRGDHHDVLHEEQVHNDNGAPTDRPKQTREEARELAHVAFGALEKLKDLPTEVWTGAEAASIRDDIKQALKRARMLKVNVDQWSDPDALPSEPAGMQTSMVEPSTIAAE